MRNWAINLIMRFDMAKSRRSQDEYLLWNSFAMRHSERRRFCNATMKDVFVRHVNLGGEDPAETGCTPTRTGYLRSLSISFGGRSRCLGGIRGRGAPGCRIGLRG